MTTPPLTPEDPSGSPSRPPSTPPDAALPLLPEARQGSLFWVLGGALKTMRPHQWMKNTFVLAPVFFAKDIFQPQLLFTALSAFLAFCLLAGAVYTMNDLVDVESDRRHPVKRLRPIPSGRVPEGMARGLAVGLVLLSLGGGLALNPWFALVALLYFLQNVAYSFRLKNVAYLDVSLISAGFVLRVVAGGMATGIKVSNYLLVCTALLALFLGFGKRRHELALATRKSLKDYTERGLNWALGVTSVATVATYLAYTLDPRTRQFFHNDWLWPSTGFTILGMARFLQIVTGRPKAESPTQEMLRDVPFILILLSWVLWVMVTIYQIRPAVQP
ncbi:MAG: decaprenyl-phosphate phosphoribosyltransferase [Polyangiaceae bacterium]|nr:decaprenyl-phosphate phosphoribosyltransferase [Polyangiaceae bacterium]